MHKSLIIKHKTKNKLVHNLLNNKILDDLWQKYQERTVWLLQNFRCKYTTLKKLGDSILVAYQLKNYRDG